MCGRYTLLTPWSELVKLYRITDSMPAQNLPPRYNIAPTQDVPVVRPADDGNHELVMMRWGLIPFWAKDLKIGYSTINAKAKTVAEKPSFREAYKKRRCLIPADGFYEWKRVGKAKQPYRITMKDEQSFSFAGLWERNSRVADEPMLSCTIVTTEPNDLLADIHNRMPAILDPADHDVWLSGDGGKELLRPFPAHRMRAYKVNPAVGNVKNAGPECIEPLERNE